MKAETEMVTRFVKGFGLVREGPIGIRLGGIFCYSYGTIPREHPSQVLRQELFRSAASISTKSPTHAP